jgi:hypothetical protein
MELIFVLGAFLALDAVAFFLDSRGDRALLHHDQALDAIRHGDIDLYRQEIARMEQEIARGAWRTL